MTIITDELVEKAAHAFYARIEEGGHDDPNWRKDMRAAILAVLPDVIEACAKVADAEVEKIKDAIGAARRDGAYEWANEAVSSGLAVEAVATAIRARIAELEKLP